jgi:hypothetical protein
LRHESRCEMDTAQNSPTRLSRCTLRLDRADLSAALLFPRSRQLGFQIQRSNCYAAVERGTMKRALADQRHQDLRGCASGSSPFPEHACCRLECVMAEVSTARVTASPPGRSHYRSAPTTEVKI